MSLRALLLAALVLAPGAAAKGDVRATLVEPEALGAPGGTEVAVRWRLSHLDPAGEVRPAPLDGVFLRLVGPGGDVEQAFGSYWSQPTGDYQATLSIPRGGVTAVEIGITGHAAPGGPADHLFAIRNADGIPRAATPGGLSWRAALPAPLVATALVVLLLLLPRLFQAARDRSGEAAHPARPSG